MKDKRNPLKKMHLINNIRPILILLSSFILMVSCSVDDPKITTIQNADVISVSLPDTLIYQQVEVFEVNFIKPTTCHNFEGFDILGDGQTVTIRTETRFEETFDCEDTPTNSETAQLEFLVERQDSYTFRFLSGKSESGLEFITVEVPIKVE